MLTSTLTTIDYHKEIEVLERENERLREEIYHYRMLLELNTPKDRTLTYPKTGYTTECTGDE